MSEFRRTTLYRCYDSRGELLYVGITNNGAGRFHQHYRDSGWWDHVASMTIEHYATRDEARGAELLAIEVEQPRFNVEGTNRSDWIDALQEAQANGYYDDLAVLHRSIKVALDRRDHLQAMAALVQRRIDEGMLALRAIRKETTTPTGAAWGPAELAQALGCTRQHIHNMITRGELRSVKLGRKRLIPADAVAELLNGGGR